LIKLYEDFIHVKCLSRDITIVKKVIPAAKLEYEAIILKELGKKVNVNIVVDTNDLLGERKITNNKEIKVANYDASLGKSDRVEKNVDDKLCFGGVILTN